MRFLPRLPRGLRSKLFLSHFLVALVGALTLLTAIVLIAPIIFGNLVGEVMDSVGRAFGQTLLYSLLAAGLAATVAAAAASLFVSKRIIDPVQRMVAATRRISAGSYGERVPVREADELGTLSESFNSMAASLQAAEEQRLELIGDVSHELRTPLSTLEGYMEGLMEGSIEPSEETWALLYEEGERMRRLVDDLSQLSRAEAGTLDLRRTSVSPRETVGRATGRMLPLFDEKRVELENPVPDDLPLVVADADRVTQVLTNLLSNALRHTPAGGVVAVGVEPRGDKAVFSVKDAGEGISSEHLPHIFKRFYRIENSRSKEGGGSGVGLAICRALVEAMGGEIWAESPGAGQGATFAFTLPISRPQQS